MKKIRVLEVAYPALNNSGVPAVIMGIVRELHAEFDFGVLVFKTEVGFHENEFRSYGGDIHVIKCDKPGNRLKNGIEKLTRPWRLFWGTRKILTQGKYDVIHCHNGRDAGWCLLAARTVGVKVRAVHSHASADPFEHNVWLKMYHNFMQSIINRFSTMRIGCSGIAADAMYGNRVETNVILNAVDLDKFSLSKYPLRPLNADEPNFIFIGRLVLQKNPFFMLEVFRLLQKRIPSARLKIIGFGDLKDHMITKIKEFGLENNIDILPHSSDIPEELSKSDILLFPSYFEGFGIVPLEAQAMGVHCFVSNAIPLEVNLGLCDFLPLSIGPEAWANTIIDYLHSCKPIKPMPELDIIGRYSWKEIAKEYRKIYTSIEAYD